MRARIDALKISVTCAHHAVVEPFMVPDVVMEGTIMPELVVPGTTLMTTHVPCYQRMPPLTTLADYTTAHILGRNAGKIQILPTSKEEDEHRLDKVVVATKDDTTTTTVALTTMVLTMVLGLVLGISTPRRHINRRIFIKINQTHQKQLVVYTPNTNTNPGVTGGTQGGSSQSTWNSNEQQQPNGSADSSSRGALKLSKRAPVQAIQTDARSIAPTITSNLTNPHFHQAQDTTGTGDRNCKHVPINSYCIICDQKTILHAFLTSQDKQANTEMKQAIDLLLCSLAIVKYIQCILSTSTSIPFQVLFDSGSDNTFIHQEALPSGATPKVISKRSGQTLTGLLSTSRDVDLREIILPKFTHSCCVNQ
jgi:hypothetical protein